MYCNTNSSILQYIFVSDAANMTVIESFSVSFRNSDSLALFAQFSTEKESHVVLVNNVIFE